MPCLYLACRLRKRLISLFRLAHWRLLLRTAPYSRLSLGVCLAAFELSSYLDPWQLGLATLFSAGYKQAPRPAGPLGGQGAPRRSLKVARQQPLDFRTTNLSRQGACRSIASFCLFLKRKIYIGDFYFTCIVHLGRH